jgi:hypothetical protein
MSLTVKLVSIAINPYGKEKSIVAVAPRRDNPSARTAD